MLDRFIAVLFAKTALFNATERQLVINNLRRIHPCVTGFDIFRAIHCPVDVACPDRRAETEDRSIGLFDRLLEIFYPDDRQRRTKDFFLDHSGSRIDISDQGRLQVKTFVVLIAFGSASAVNNLAAAFHRIFHLLFDLLPLLLGVKRAHEYSRFETVTDADLFRFFDQLLYKWIGDTVEEIEALHCQAGLPAIEKPPHGRGAYRSIEIGIITYDHRIAAAQLQGPMFKIFRRGLHPSAASVRCAGEADLADLRTDQKLFTDYASRTRHNVQNPFGTTAVLNRFIDDLAAANVGQWRGAGGLHDDRVACQQCRAELVTHQRDRKIPWHDRSAYAQRLAENQPMPTGIEHHGAGAHGFCHAAVMIQGMDESADFQNRFAHRFSLFFGQ